MEGQQLWIVLFACCMLCSAEKGESIQFQMEYKECLSYDVTQAAQIVHVSFVVIEQEQTMYFQPLGVDLIVSLLFMVLLLSQFLQISVNPYICVHMCTFLWKNNTHCSTKGREGRGKWGLQIAAPSGQPMYVVRHVMGEKFNFTAMKKGLYKFCFYNRSWQQETVNLHVHIGPMLPKQQPIRTGGGCRFILSYNLFSAD